MQRYQENEQSAKSGEFHELRKPSEHIENSNLRLGSVESYGKKKMLRPQKPHEFI